MKKNQKLWKILSLSLVGIGGMLMFRENINLNILGITLIFTGAFTNLLTD